MVEEQAVRSITGKRIPITAEQSWGRRGAPPLSPCSTATVFYDSTGRSWSAAERTTVTVQGASAVILLPTKPAFNAPMMM